MKSAYYFLDQDYSEEQLKLRVLKGFHSLHHYANEFWFQHLLQYAQCEDAVQDDHIAEALDELREFWLLPPGEAARSLKLDDTTSADSIETQLLALAGMPQAHCMGRDILTFRAFLMQEKYAHQEPEGKPTSLFI